MVMTGDGGLVEVQATAERTPLSRAHLDDLLELAAAGGIARAARAAAGDGTRRDCSGRGWDTGMAVIGDDDPLALMLSPPATRTKLREFNRLLASGSDCTRRAAARVRSTLPTRGRRHVRGQRACPRRARRRPRPAGSRSPTTPGSRPPRSADAPGVRSARFAGEGGQAGSDASQPRQAARARPPLGSGLRYVCALAWVDPISRDPDDPLERIFEGVVCRERWRRPPPGEGGFGYDPAFLPARRSSDGRTMAQLSDEEKGAISHRGAAVSEHCWPGWQPAERARGRGVAQRTLIERGNRGDREASPRRSRNTRPSNRMSSGDRGTPGR